jgi:hypothetical protein
MAFIQTYQNRGVQGIFTSDFKVYKVVPETGLINNVFTHGYTANQFTMGDIPKMFDQSYQVNDRTGKIIVYEGEGNNAVPKQYLIDNGNQLEDIKDSINVLTNAVKAIPTTITASASASSGGGSGAASTDDTPMVSVTVNTNFDVPLSVYDDMQSGTSSDEKVQVVNSNVGDRLIHLKGKLTQTGIFQYKINDKYFNIKVIENPTATNVVVRLE